MENQLNPDQITDIKTREKEALEHLKRLELTPACQVFKKNIGNDIFADMVVPYLQDLKYSGGVKSPYNEPAAKN